MSANILETKQKPSCLPLPFLSKGSENGIEISTKQIVLFV